MENNSSLIKLENVVEVQNGYAFKANDFGSTGIPVIKIKNIQPPNISFEDAQYYPGEINDRLKQFFIFKKDILISMTGSHISQISSAVGKVGRYGFNSPALLNQRVGKIYSKNELKLNNDFLYYLISRPEVQFELATNAGGSANQANISPQQIKSLEFEIPDINTQSRIASILSSLDDKIELNRRMNQTLEQMAQALFNRYFVDNIDPDNLPEGWRNSVLKEFGNIVCGKTPSKSIQENFNGEVLFIKIPDMHGLPFILKTQDSLTEQGANSQKNKFIPEGSICVSCIATVGLVSITTERSQTNQQINSIIPSKPIYKYFLYFSLRALCEHLKMLGGGGTMTLNVNTTLFSNIELAKPADEKILQFDKTVKPIMELVLTNLIENEKLVTIRDNLLPKLMSGEIDVEALMKEEEQ